MYVFSIEHNVDVVFLYEITIHHNRPVDLLASFGNSVRYFVIKKSVKHHVFLGLILEQNLLDR